MPFDLDALHRQLATASAELAEIRKLLHGESTCPGWVACETRLPSTNGRFLGWSDRWEGPIIVYRFLGGPVWLDDESTCPLDANNMPTHWMPLPVTPAAI